MKPTNAISKKLLELAYLTPGILMAYAPFYDGEYIYYTIMRIIVSLLACYFAIITKDGDGYFAEVDSKYPIMFIVVALIYNPIFPIHLDKISWTPINIISSLAWMYYFIERKISHRKKNNLKSSELINNKVITGIADTKYTSEKKEVIQNQNEKIKEIYIKQRLNCSIECLGINSYKRLLQYESMTMNSIIELFQIVLCDHDLVLYEYEIDVGQNTCPSKAKYISDRPDLLKKGLSFLYETINQRNYHINFYVTPGKDNWISYFLFQAGMDLYSNAYRYPEYDSYRIVVDEVIITSLKKKLNATEYLKYMPFINNEYPYLYIENEAVKIQLFIEDTDGFKLITAQIELRVHFHIIETLLIEKGMAYGLLF